METDDLPVNASQAANENTEAKDMTETSISEPVDVEAKATAIDASLSTTGNTGAPPSPVRSSGYHSYNLPHTLSTYSVMCLVMYSEKVWSSFPFSFGYTLVIYPHCIQ